jgi:hypothetical protein
MAARTAQLALLVDQLMPALQAKPPVFAGNIYAGRDGAGIGPKVLPVVTIFLGFSFHPGICNSSRSF